MMITACSSQEVENCNSLPCETAMNAKHKIVQIAGILAIAIGSLFSLNVLLRLALSHFENAWAFVDGLLGIAVGAYGIRVGVRAIRYSRGQPRRPGFGWGRILFGTVVLYSSAVEHFHLFAVHHFIEPLEASNPAQAEGMKVGEIMGVIICTWLIVSGIRAGFRKPELKAEIDAAQPHA